MDYPFKIYVDSCIPSQFFDLESVPKKEIVALGKLADCKHIEFVTSDKMLDEIMNCQSEERKNMLKFFYRLFGKVQRHKKTFVEGLIGTFVIGVSRIGEAHEVDDFLYAKLKKHFPDEADAEHLFQARRNNCKYFLTLDTRTILNNVKTIPPDLRKILGTIEILSPSQTVQHIKHFIKEKE